MTEPKITPLDRALVKLNQKIHDQIQSEVFAHADNLLRRINSVIVEFFNTHKVPYNEHANMEHPDPIAREVVQLVKDVANRAEALEQQRLLEQLGEEIIKRSETRPPN